MHVPTPQVNASGLRVGLVVSRYHAEITSALARGARDAFARAGGSEADLLEVASPGTFELPAICAAFANDTPVDAVVALGCVIAGETRHDRYIAGAVADGLMRIAIDTGRPVAFGVLTVGTIEQARARAGGAKGNKGAEAMVAAIEAALAIRAILDDGGER
ncbi:MAG: 6,7-dimethyl-8-ribityllumazine synthase [Phycisphaerales bacterium]